MELRRRRSLTPRKSLSADPHAFTARRSSRKASMNGSQSGSNGSVSSRRNSVNENGPPVATVSPRDPNHSSERAAKRRKLSVGSKSTPSHASFASNNSNSSSGGSRRSSRRESGPLSTITETPVQKRRPKRASESTLDEIVVNVPEENGDGSNVQSPNLESPTVQAQIAVSPPSQRSTRLSTATSVPGRRSPRNGDKTNGTDLQPVKLPGNEDHADEVDDESTKKESGPERRITNGHTAIVKLKISPQRRSARKRSSTPGADNGQPEYPTQTEHISQISNATADNTDNVDTKEVDEELQGVEVPDEDLGDLGDDVEMAEADTDGDVPENEDEENSQELLDDLDDEGEGEEENEDEMEDADGEDGEIEDEPVSDQSKVDNDDGESVAESNLDDESPSKMAVPKVITTLASPLRTISEEDADGAQSPISALGDELTASGPGKAPRKLPGRRRAPHAIPKVEAALRRQLQLRVRYRAVAKQLKPLLAELAKRSIKDLKNDAEAPVKAREYDIVKKRLDEKMQARLARSKEEDRYNKDKIKLLFDSETDRIKTQYQQAKINAVDTFINHLKYDFLMAVRKHNIEDDEHASDDESGNIITSLYHVDMHGKRTHILDRAHDSRSRRIIETDRLFRELCDRGNMGEEDLPDDVEPPPTKPAAFTYFDPTDREANEHDRKVSALITALTQASQEPKVPAAQSISNAEAVNLQVLADASVSAPPPPSASIRPTMASLLNSDDQHSRPTYAAAPARNLFADVYQNPVYQQPPGVVSADYNSAPNGLLPAFPEATGAGRDAVPKSESTDSHGPNARPSLMHLLSQPSRPGDVPTNGTGGLGQQPSAGSPTARTTNRHPKGAASPEKHDRRASLIGLAAAGTTPGQNIGPSPTQSRLEPQLRQDATRLSGQNEGRDPRSQEPRPLPPLLTDTTRNRSISDSYGSHNEHDSRRPSEANRGIGPGHNSIFNRYGRDSSYDALLRRSTISAMDSSRRFSPGQSHMPPHLHRAGTGPAALSPTGPAPTDRYGRPLHDYHHPGPPFSAQFSQSSLPPVPPGLPPPPPPPGYGYPPGSHPGQVAPPPQTLQPGHYGPPTTFGRPQNGHYPGPYPGPPPPAARDGRDPRDQRDARDGRHGSMGRDGRDTRDGRGFYR
ncbi:hypothetical protein BDZ85DRAFT_252830 [Elsinoe ampelina]|uniref:Sds3-like-domain-containing protein n=1 Tax=Elsinoe ampelina TaxID=302913 RepID=A0A6A6G0W3_9PEZI|nr:hypothetical protein BDZ85DRAFT_252830 [Elsinoe ampelina]